MQVVKHNLQFVEAEKRVQKRIDKLHHLARTIKAGGVPQQAKEDVALRTNKPPVPLTSSSVNLSPAATLRLNAVTTAGSPSQPLLQSHLRTEGRTRIERARPDTQMSPLKSLEGGQSASFKAALLFSADNGTHST